MSESTMDGIATDLLANSDAAPTRPSASKVYDLASPFTSKEGTTVDALTLREPTVGEVAMAERELTAKVNLKTGRAYQAKLIATVAGLDPGDLTGLPASVFVGAARYLQDWVELYAGSFRPEDECADMLGDASFLINLDIPIAMGGVDELTQLMLSEPTIAELQKAETWLKEYTPTDRRNFEIALIMIGTGQKSTLLIHKLPVSVANKAAAYMRRFTQPDPATGKT